MKLTGEEEETINISNEGKKLEIGSCTQSLIGKSLTCKPFNKKAAKNTLRRAWGLEDKVQIVEVGSNLFQFKFNSEFDLELLGHMWIMLGTYVNIELANPFDKTHFTCNSVDLGCVLYFKEQEFKSSIKAMKIGPRNKWRKAVH